MRVAPAHLFVGGARIGFGRGRLRLLGPLRLVLEDVHPQRHVHLERLGRPDVDRKSAASGDEPEQRQRAIRSGLPSLLVSRRVRHVRHVLVVVDVELALSAFAGQPEMRLAAPVGEVELTARRSCTG